MKTGGFVSISKNEWEVNKPTVSYNDTCKVQRTDNISKEQNGR